MKFKYLALALIGAPLLAMEINPPADPSSASNTAPVSADDDIIRSYIPAEGEWPKFSGLRTNLSVKLGERSYRFAGGSVTEKHSYFADATRKISSASELIPELGFADKNLIFVEVSVDIFNDTIFISYKYQDVINYYFKNYDALYVFTVATALEGEDALKVRDALRSSDKPSALAYRIFPDVLSYEEMDILSQGGHIVSNGYKIMAVDLELIKTKLPASLRRVGRNAMSVVGLASAGSAQKINGVKDSSNIKIQNYKYESNIGPDFQFSVYFIDYQEDMGDIKILDRIARQDRIENIKFLYGECHADVIADDILSKINVIKFTQVDPLIEQLENIKIRVAKAFAAQDFLAFEYLEFIRQQVETELFVAKQKLYFLEVRAPDELKKDTGLKASDLFKIMDMTCNSVFHTSKILEQFKIFKTQNPQAEELAKKYAQKK